MVKACATDTAVRSVAAAINARDVVRNIMAASVVPLVIANLSSTIWLHGGRTLFYL
jgi:hypothetical protein